MGHTSGVRDDLCQGGGSSLGSFVQPLAASRRQFLAGTAFSYGNSPFLVVGRLIELLGVADFASRGAATPDRPFGHGRPDLARRPVGPTPPPAHR